MLKDNIQIKHILLGAIVVGAFALLVVSKYVNLSSFFGGGTPPAKVTANVSALQTEIDSIGKTSWNADQYKIVWSKIELEDIDTATKANLYQNLEIQYGSAMIKSFDKWIADDCAGIDIRGLTNLMRAQVGKTGLPRLKAQLNLYQEYCAIFAIRGGLNNFLKGEFTPLKANEYRAAITEKTDHPVFMNISAVINERNDLNEKLNAFTTLVSDYNFYNIRKKYREMEDICPRLRLYPYYLEQAQLNNVCKPE